MRAGKTQMTVDELRKWLDGITLTKPVTLADKAELKQMIRSSLVGFDGVMIDVYSTRDQDEVHVRVEYLSHLIEKTYHAG